MPDYPLKYNDGTGYKRIQAGSISDDNYTYLPADVKQIETSLATHLLDFTSHKAEKASNPDDANVGIHGMRVQDGQLQFYSGTEWVDVGDARTHQWCPDFSNAVLSDCELDTNGDAVLGILTQNITDSSIVNMSERTIFVYPFLAGKFIASGNADKVKVSVKLKKTGAPPNPLEVHIYTDSGGNPGASIGSANIQVSDILLTATILDVTVDLSQGVVNGNTYYVLLTATGTDLDNQLKWQSKNDLASGGNAYVSVDGVTWNSFSYESFWFQVGGGALSGTVTEDVAIESIYAWKKYYRKVTTGANSSVACAIKDTSDNVLNASVADGDSLSAIDARTYKTIRQVHTLTRVSTSDTTPKLHYREVTYQGEDYLARATNDEVTP